MTQMLDAPIQSRPVRARTSERFTRNATLEDLAAILESQQARKFDTVMSSSAIRAEGGALLLEGTGEVELTPEGVTTKAGLFVPTGVCDEGIAAKLGIPSAYLRKMRTEAPDLYDANVNGWLQRDDRNFMVRTFKDQAGGPGVARAFLSDSYKRNDNLDMLMATLEGIHDAGVRGEIQCDLSDRRMFVRIVVPQIRAYAASLLRNYRSPFSGASGLDNPTVFAGLEVRNSETGCGAFAVVPRLVFEVCTNGMTITKDALRKVHIGSKMDEGIVAWSEETQRKSLELARLQARDAVTTFLNRDYVEKKIREMEKAAGAPIADPEKTIKVVAKEMKYTEEQRAGILSHFIRGGDVSAGGVLHAVTSLAQTVEDPDEAAELEAGAMRAMELAATR